MRSWAEAKTLMCVCSTAWDLIAASGVASGAELLAQLGQLALCGSGPSRLRASAVLVTVSLAGNGANHGTIAAFTGQAPPFLAAVLQSRVHDLEHKEGMHVWASHRVLNAMPRSSRPSSPAHSYSTWLLCAAAACY